jgi:hypothetical protein
MPSQFQLRAQPAINQDAIFTIKPWCEGVGHNGIHYDEEKANDHATSCSPCSA